MNCFSLISWDEIGFMFSCIFWHFWEVWECFDIQETPRCRTSNTFPLSSIPNKTLWKDDRKSIKCSSVYECVCAFVPLWWSVCRSCCRSLISARIWGLGVSHSAPSPGFYLPPSESDPELWTTAREKKKIHFSYTVFLPCFPKVRRGFPASL